VVYGRAEAASFPDTEIPETAHQELWPEASCMTCVRRLDRAASAATRGVTVREGVAATQGYCEEWEEGAGESIIFQWCPQDKQRQETMTAPSFSTL